MRINENNLQRKSFNDNEYSKAFSNFQKNLYYYFSILAYIMEAKIAKYVQYNVILCAS